MIPALLETLGALSLLASVAAKIMLLRDVREDPANDAPVPRVCATCFRRCEAHRERRVRAPFRARCARAAAGRAAFARIRRHG
jgi:hypothetical protein